MSNDRRVWLDSADILNIPQEHLPLMVLSDNTSSFISWAIKARTKGKYNHFMWMHRPGFVVSQNMFLGEQPVQDYLQNCGIKLWWDPEWTKADRIRLLMAIKTDLNKPKWQRRYDFLQILGKLLPWAEWLNMPGTRICSDYANYLKLVDPRYNLYHPAPSEVNRWLQGHSEYQVYGRYRAD